MVAQPRDATWKWSLIWLALAVLVLPFLVSTARSDDDEPKPKTVASPESRTVEVVFADEGKLWMILEIDTLELETPYGKLSIPVEEVRRITPATRYVAEAQERIDKAIANLGSADFAVREAASKELAAMQERAYPALLKASKHSDPEIARHIKELIEKLKSVVSAERLQVREFDVIETPHSTISGQLVLKSLPVKTTQFGKQNVLLADVQSLRSIHSEASEKEDALPVEPDPGNMTGLRETIGKKYAFRVTGRVDGTVYGTGVYTTDSHLATAVVHSGALKVGETGIVRVSVIPSPASFTATTQHGVTSHAWGAYPSAYQVHVPKKKK